VGRADRSPVRGRALIADTLVLCYHAVSETWPANLSVTPGRLRRQLEHLLEKGYRGATFHEAATSPRPRRTLVVTFDDGYTSVLELAYPILSSLGLPATVFAVSELADGHLRSWAGPDRWLGGPHEHELQGLTWTQLGELADAGWEVGSHTRRHPRLTKLDDEELAEELRASREACEAALGHPCRTLAYPYGDVDERVVAAVRAAGYEAAAALPAPLTRANAHAWPRVGVYHDDGPLRFRLKTSRPLRRARIALAPVEGLVRGRR
jgi:peptidoglycan/xylan/chitin deacetylase (PgdA/CDA1 family)